MAHLPEVVMYGRKAFCPDVARSRARLTDLGIAWTEHDIEADPEARERTVRLTGGASVPTLVIGEAVLVEPSNTELDAALSAVGYDVSDD